ncbi:hypothetical protein [Desulfosarcina variabilis]|uniref:hypothetical protein n=1 Tax=Desulfosarcina variabilis TaxID=2300 RepID=UPI003AFAD5DC
MAQIGEKVELSRQTVAKYRLADGWDAELALVAEAAKVKAVDIVTDKISVAFDRHLSNLEALDRRIETLLTEEKLNPAAVAQLAKAASTIIQSTRLLNDQSTANHAVDARVSPAGTHPGRTEIGSAGFDKAMDFIMKTGDENGQCLLSQLIEIRQKIVSIADTD